MVDTVLLLGAEDRDRVSEEMQQAVELERSIANVSKHALCDY